MNKYILDFNPTNLTIETLLVSSFILQFFFYLLCHKNLNFLLAKIKLVFAFVLKAHSETIFGIWKPF